MRWIPIILLCLGCSDILEKALGEGDSSSSLETEEGEVVTDADGMTTVSVRVDEGESAFMITADGEHLVALESITNPVGEKVFDWEDWYDVNTNLTSAIWPNASEMVLNWPIRDEDGDIYPGKWSVVLSATQPSADGYNRYQSGSKINVIVQTKNDEDFDNGVVNIRLVYADGVDDNAAVTTAMAAGIERWREIWAPLGLRPNVTIESSSFDPDLPYPGDGSEEIYELVLDSDEQEITMIVGETILGGTDYLGVSGGIPGTLTANTRSAVVLSWLASAGPDGGFDDIDITILGETMAHEIGHYMGLFHPVEQAGWNTWDACADTPDCTSESRCTDQLGDNLMFPSPVCDMSGCVEQDQLSNVQAEILHRYTGAL